MKKYLVGVFIGLLGISGVFAASNFFTDSWTIYGRGSFNNTPIAWIDSNRDLSLYDGDVVLGGIATTPSQSNYFGVDIPFYNVGSALTQGDIVIASNTGTGYVRVSPATTDLTNVVGAAQGAVASGAVGFIRVAGLAILKSTGTIAIGDAIVSTVAAAGYVGADTTPTTGAKIGVALESASGDGDLFLAILTH